MNSKVFTIPSRNLFCLSGQQHDSKVVLDRIREGTKPERNLVREELGLTGSLGLIWETGDMFCRQVILALVEMDRRTRVEVLEQVERNIGKLLRI